jgi:hypothetical protein
MSRFYANNSPFFCHIGADRWGPPISSSVNSLSICDQCELLAISKNIAVLCDSNVKSWFSRIWVEMSWFYANNQCFTFRFGKKICHYSRFANFAKLMKYRRKNSKISIKIWSLVVIFILQNLMFIWAFELTTSKTDTAHSNTALPRNECYRMDVFILIRVAILYY